MDFQLTDEQMLLQDTARALLAPGANAETRNRVTDTDPGFDTGVWKRLADAGILGLGLEPEAGGPVEIMVVATEIGRALASEPIVTAALAPGALVAELDPVGQRRLLDSVASGQTLIAFAHQEPGMRRLRVEATTRATRDGDGWQLTGCKNPVLAGDNADIFIVSAALPEGATGLFLVEADAVQRHPYRTFDGLRAAQIDLDKTPAKPLGSTTDASVAATGTVVRMLAALCAEAVGVMEETLRLTTDYLKNRKQFGVQLSSFQALTQRAADMYVSLELARSISLYVNMSVAENNLDPTVAARAKVRVGRSARHIAQEAVQLHGGIGMTWEHPVSHYVARLTAIEATLGSTQDHLHTLIEQVGRYEIVAL